MRVLLLRLIFTVVLAMVLVSSSWFPWGASLEAGGGNLSVPVRWCGIEGAPSMADPGVVGEATTDDVLWRRHERPSDQIYIPLAAMTFRSAATGDIKNGPQSFPIIRDPLGTGGNIGSQSEATDATTQCRRAWLFGDPLYYDANNNGVVNATVDTLLSDDTPAVGFVELGHNGAPLAAVPAEVKFVDLDGDGAFDVGERIYRDENDDGTVDPGDTLLSAGTLGTVVGNVDPADVLASLLAVPAQVKYLDLIRQPANTFNIGYPSVVGITAVSASDFDIPGLGFPVHGIAALGICGDAALMDDPSFYLPPGPDFRTFETQLVGHEFGHAFCLQHGDGFDDNTDGMLDNGDDPASPFALGFPGTLCDSNNVMQYCWHDTGAPAAPTMVWVGSGTPIPGILTGAQVTVVRTHAMALPDTVVDPVPLPLRSERSDVIGEIPEAYAHVDLGTVAVTVEPSGKVTTFSLTTRRPFPRIFTSTFYVIVDADNNPATGGAPAALGVPTDLKGAELVFTLTPDRNATPPITASAVKFDPAKGAFAPLSGRIAASWVTLDAIVDYPGPSVRVAERLAVRLTDDARGPLAATFRVEYLAVDVPSKTVDRARTQMNFATPVFPQCKTDPEVIPAGGTATVTASGLLPSRSVHVLIGDRQVGTAESDAAGSATATFVVPRRTSQGKHLITVGALAVTGDCFLVVKGQRNLLSIALLLAILVAIVIYFGAGMRRRIQ